MAVGKRAWGSAKQKAALEKARLASARKRRGTGMADKVSLAKKAAPDKPGSRFLRKDPVERKESIRSRVFPDKSPENVAKKADAPKAHVAYRDVSLADQRKLDSVGDEIARANREVIKSSAVEELSQSLGSLASVNEHIMAIEDTIKVLDRMGDTSPKAQAARKRLRQLKGELESIILNNSGKKKTSDHNPRQGVYGADKWGRRPGGR